MLPNSWGKKVLDVNVQPLDKAALAWADLVFLSAMNVQEESVREIAKLCNQAKVPIVGGGSLFTHEYERFPEIDYFVLNEAEITLPLFLKDFEDNKAQHTYQTKLFADMEQSPIPAFDLVNMDDYSYSIIQYSRGCPYMCDFCDVTALFGRRPRVKTTEQVIAELELIEAQVSGGTLVLFADDNLIGNKKLLKTELLPALIKWRKERKPASFFATQLTINLADDEELMQMMIDAGFRHIFVGIETPDEASLKVSRKNQNLKRNIMDNINLLHTKGFIIWGGFIVGFDTDDESTFQRQINFLQASGIPLPIVNVLKAPPGTELYERMKKENRLSKDFAFAEGDTNLIPIMGEKALFEGYLQVIDAVYQPKNALKRIKQFFRTYSYPSNNLKIPTKYSWKEVNVLYKTLYRVAVTSKVRPYFWNLLWWTIWNKPKYTEKALLYGVLMEQMFGTYKTIKTQVKQSIKEIELREERKIAV